MKTNLLFLTFVSAVLWSTTAARGDSEADLGGLLYSDPNLSLNRNQSCATCHSLAPITNGVPGAPWPAPAFVDPENIRSNQPVSRGSISGQFGALNAPSAGYAAFSPSFHWDPEGGTYVGGQFWNGRAATLQAQAALPLLNPAEMAMPSRWAVVTRIKENTVYRQLFGTVFGLNLDDVPTFELAPASNTAPASVSAVYDAAAQAIAQFERTRSFNQFTAKFDFWLAGMTLLTSNELHGLDLFKNKAGCAACHPADATMDAAGKVIPPLFTDFTYDNIGLPRNWNIPGAPMPDPGLGGRADIATAAAGDPELGKHKVMSLRNIAITPPYGHNGVFATLEQIVHFYNTRDVLGEVNANTNAGFAVTGWPAPEVPQNVNQDELGDLSLTAQEEADLVAFLKTLTDNYPASGVDPNLPPGTSSPYADVLPPAIPTILSLAAPGRISIHGRLGQFYRVDYTDRLGTAATNSWQSLMTARLLTNGLTVIDTNAAKQLRRFYRTSLLP